ncbi:MAG: hypothetical protein Q9161_002317 [Pseudevernia consocians]
MFGVWLILLASQVSLSPTAQPTSLPLPFHNAPSAFTETTRLRIANQASISFPNPSNGLSLLFTNSGASIPPAELLRTLSVASARVQDYLPLHANAPIANDYFEANASSPETGDNVSISIDVFGYGLSWLQLSHVLTILQQYMLGTGPDHADAHDQQLEFLVQLVGGVEVALGTVGYTSGARAVGKRDSITAPLQLPHANSSSPNPLALPIIFNIPNTNLDLHITSLGLPIPESIALTTIEEAYTDIILNHTDIDAPMPGNQPYSFNASFGRWFHFSTTEITIRPYRRKQVSWGVVCILIYGLRDFMRETARFNAMSFELNDARLGRMAQGKLLYEPAASTGGLKTE